MRICPACAARHDAAVAACPACGWSAPLVDRFPAFAPELNAEGAAGFRPEAFEELARHEAGNFWFQGRNRLLRWVVARHAARSRKALEIGCGTGFVLSAMAEWFPGASHHGSEIFTAGLSFAARRAPAVKLMQMDARHLGYEDEFDLIGAYDVLEHIKEDDRVLSQIYTALTPGGVLCVTVPQHPWLYSHADTYACHERRYARGELEAKMERTGFSVEYSTSFVTLLLPLMVLSRLMQRHQPASNYDPSAELRLSPMMNGLLAALMRCELLLLKAGLRLPIGGSRLVVARKAPPNGR